MGINVWENHIDQLLYWQTRKMNHYSWLTLSTKPGPNLLLLIAPHAAFWP